MSAESEIRRTMERMQKIFEREISIVGSNIYANFDQYYSEFRIDHEPTEAERLSYEKCEVESK